LGFVLAVCGVKPAHSQVGYLVICFGKILNLVRVKHASLVVSMQSI
jgi:hypothetical protein